MPLMAALGSRHHSAVLKTLAHVDLRDGACLSGGQAALISIFFCCFCAPAVFGNAIVSTPLVQSWFCYVTVAPAPLGCSTRRRGLQNHTEVLSA
jgi:hypothetical protein